MDTKTDNTWEPRGDQILVRPLIAAERTEGGLYMPDSARERPQRGVVIAVGPGLASELSGLVIQPQSEVGDLALFGKFAGMTEELDGEPVLIMRDQEVLARRRPGNYALVEHLDARGRRVWHEEGLKCEHCPAPTLDAERAKLQEQNREALQ